MNETKIIHIDENTQRIELIDDNGGHWQFNPFRNGGTIFMVEAEEEMKQTGEEEANGYGCDDFFDGCRLLVEYDYIEDISSYEILLPDILNVCTKESLLDKLILYLDD